MSLMVIIQAYDLIVRIDSSDSYPDALNDISNRAQKIFNDSVDKLASHKIPISGGDRAIEDEDEFEDED